MTENMEKLNELFDKLVPGYGKADTLAGEIVRAVTRIGYRFFNDGDRIGVDYGNETCNPAARFLIIKMPERIGDFVTRLWDGTLRDHEYENYLDELIRVIVEYLDANDLESVVNTEDFIMDYQDESDFDYEDNDDDEWPEDEEDDEWPEDEEDDEWPEDEDQY